MTETSKGAAHWNKMVGVRLDPKMRYLAELAADAKSFPTLTDYIKWALEESFKNVTLRVAEKPEAILDEAGNWSFEEVDQEAERLANDHMSIANQGELLWSESEYLRLLMLHKIAPRRVSDEDKALLTYIENRKDLQTPVDGRYKLNRDKINNEWDSIKAAFAKTKGKVK
jgi:GH35 family endo-1,4-beta-xylanase